MNTHNKLRAKIEIVATLSLGMQHFWYFAISSQGQTHLSLMQSVECVWFVCELLSSSLFVLQVITSFCSLLFGFRRIQYITSIGLFYKNRGFYLEVVWLWRISGGFSQEVMWLTLQGGLLEFDVQFFIQFNSLGW